MIYTYRIVHEQRTITDKEVISMTFRNIYFCDKVYCAPKQKKSSFETLIQHLAK